MLLPAVEISIFQMVVLIAVIFNCVQQPENNRDEAVPQGNEDVEPLDKCLDDVEIESPMCRSPQETDEEEEHPKCLFVRSSFGSGSQQRKSLIVSGPRRQSPKERLSKESTRLHRFKHTIERMAQRGSFRHSPYQRGRRSPRSPRPPRRKHQRRDTLQIGKHAYNLKKISSTLSTSGAFWVMDGHLRIGIFKPVGAPGEANLRRGIDLVEQHKKELAAYTLDQSFVPKTSLEHAVIQGTPTCGSFQIFSDNCGDAEKLGETRFSQKSIHRMAILDIRLFNTDRNLMNALISESSDEKVHDLVPIDHALCLPPWTIMEEFDELCWLLWKKAANPLTQDEREFVANLDPRTDYEMLSNLDIKPEQAFTCYLTTTFLKICAGRELNLAQIGSFFSRNYTVKPSQFEEIRDSALASAGLSYLDVDVSDLDSRSTKRFMEALVEKINAFVDKENQKAFV